MKRVFTAIVSACLFITCVNVNAGVINFDDISLSGDRAQIEGNYLGHTWNSATDQWAGTRGTNFGWGVGNSTTDEQLSTAGGAYSGENVGWNLNGGLDLSITFSEPQNISGAWFRWFGVATYGIWSGSDVSNIQLQAYDATNSQIGSSSILTLSNSWQYLSADFSSVSHLVFLANGGVGDPKWYAIDDIGITPSAVPIPPAAWLFVTGLLGLIGIARRKCSK